MDIFISYRREDTSGYALGLRREVQRALPEANLFLDVESIAAGDKWREAIHQRMGSCDLVLVLIGDEWLERRDHLRKITEPDDPVRAELASALSRDVHMIPVLVEETPMPHPSDLPEDVRGLCDFNALPIHDLTYEQDVKRLVSSVLTLLADRRLPIADDVRSQAPPGRRYQRGDIDHEVTEFPSRITESWLQGIVPSMTRKDLVSLIVELKHRGWTEEDIYGFALTYSPLLPSRKIPASVNATWLESNVPLLSIERTRRLIEELRRRRWTDDEIQTQVLAHHPSAPGDEIPSRIYPAWLDENAPLMTSRQQRRLSAVLRERGWQEREIRRYLPLG